MLMTESFASSNAMVVNNSSSNATANASASAMLDSDDTFSERVCVQYGLRGWNGICLRLTCVLACFDDNS